MGQDILDWLNTKTRMYLERFFFTINLLKHLFENVSDAIASMV